MRICMYIYILKIDTRNLVIDTYKSHTKLAQETYSLRQYITIIQYNTNFIFITCMADYGH